MIAIPSDSGLLIPIKDPELEWRATNIIWQAEEEKKWKETEKKKNSLRRIDEEARSGEDSDGESTTFIIVGMDMTSSIRIHV